MNPLSSGDTWPPSGARLLVSFEVRGEPKPAGSKVSGVVTKVDPETNARVPVRRPGGGFKTFTKDSSGEAGSNWRTDVRAACQAALDEAHELVDGPLAVRVTFGWARSSSHYGTGRNAGVLKATAPRYPHRSKMGDGTKLTRALEDALTSYVWTDDKRVCDCWWSRRYGMPGARVDIFTMTELVGQLETSAGADQLAIMQGNGNGDHAEAIHR